MSDIEALEAALDRQAKAHALLIDRLPTAVAVFDGTKRLASWNSAYRDMWQLDDAYLENTPTRRRDPRQAALRASPSGARRLSRLEEPRSSPLINPSRRARIGGIRPDGRALRVVSSPNPQGGVTYLFDDVTERMQLASQFEALTRVQSETLDTLKEGVAVFGPDGKLKLHNLAFQTSWNLSPALLATAARMSTRSSNCARRSRLTPRCGRRCVPS